MPNIQNQKRNTPDQHKQQDNPEHTKNKTPTKNARRYSPITDDTKAGKGGTNIIHKHQGHKRYGVKKILRVDETIQKDETYDKYGVIHET